MWIWDALSSHSFGFRFAIRYPIRFCCPRELDSIVSWVLKIYFSFPTRLPPNRYHLSSRRKKSLRLSSCQKSCWKRTSFFPHHLSSSKNLRSSTSWKPRGQKQEQPGVRSFFLFTNFARNANCNFRTTPWWCRRWKTFSTLSYALTSIILEKISKTNSVSRDSQEDLTILNFLTTDHIIFTTCDQFKKNTDNILLLLPSCVQTQTIRVGQKQ